MDTMMMNWFSSIGIGSFGVLAVELLSELGVTRVPKLEVKVNYSLCVCCHETSSALYPVERRLRACAHRTSCRGELVEAALTQLASSSRTEQGAPFARETMRLRGVET